MPIKLVVSGTGKPKEGVELTRRRPSLTPPNEETQDVTRNANRPGSKTNVGCCVLFFFSYNAGQVCHDAWEKWRENERKVRRLRAQLLRRAGAHVLDPMIYANVDLATALVQWVTLTRCERGEIGGDGGTAPGPLRLDLFDFLVRLESDGGGFWNSVFRV